MPIRPDDLLALATNLQAQSDSEAALRSAASRAYYAALHRTDEIFKGKVQHERQTHESSHEEIITRAFKYGKALLPGRGSAAEIAQALTRLRRERNRADYRLAEQFSPMDCEAVLTRVRKVFVLCDDLLVKCRAKEANPT